MIQLKSVITVILFFCFCSFIFPQNRVIHNNKEIFLSGMNLAWVNFAQDLTKFDEASFTTALGEISSAGGNSMRWWLHIDGRYSPKFKKDKVSGITQKEIDNMKKALDLAYDHDMGMIMCLWSFDMLRKSIGKKYTDRNKLMLSDTAYSMAYIRNALVPLLQQLGEHPAVICWEVFNEPEGMSNEFGWDFNEHVPMSDIQRFINLVAGSVHRIAPQAKVSNGSWSFIASSDIGTYKNYYTDSALISAGGDSAGILDFYMVHYYDWGGTEISPFHHHADYWQLDKPIVIAEFSANGPYPGIMAKAAYDSLYSNGYAGALSWTWTGHDGHGNVTDATPGLQYLLKNYPKDIVIGYKEE
jgi:hypothetical protein